jgi:hypothetical protein
VSSRKYLTPRVKKTLSLNTVAVHDSVGKLSRYDMTIAL